MKSRYSGVTSNITGERKLFLGEQNVMEMLVMELEK